MKITKKSKLNHQYNEQIPPDKRFDYLFELISLSLKLTPNHKFTYLEKGYSVIIKKRI